MKSIAIFCKLRDGVDEKQLYSKILSNKQTSSGDSNKQYSNEKPQNYPDVCEVHTNIWKVYEGNISLTPEYYFDLGLLVSFKCASIKLFLPFSIHESDNYDLCTVMMKHADLLCAIFNDNMLLHAQNNSCFTKVEKQAKATEFYLYQINNDNLEFEIYQDKDNKEGTFMTINFVGFPGNEDIIDMYANQQLYVRLRFKIKKPNDFCITESISNDLIQAAFSKNSLFDFRFNETREIDGKVLEKMSKNGYRPCYFNKLHVFYITDTREKVDNGSALKIDSRLLEKDHWKTYEPQSALRNVHYVAHHWRKRCKDGEEPFSDFSVFFSSIYPEVHFLKLITYFVIVILLGWIGSMLSFPISDIFDKCNESVIKALIIIVLVVLTILYILNENFGIVWMKIFRKR